MQFPSSQQAQPASDSLGAQSALHSVGRGRPPGVRIAICGVDTKAVLSVTSSMAFSHKFQERFAADMIDLRIACGDAFAVNRLLSQSVIQVSTVSKDVEVVVRDADVVILAAESIASVRMYANEFQAVKAAVEHTAALNVKVISHGLPEHEKDAFRFLFPSWNVEVSIRSWDVSALNNFLLSMHHERSSTAHFAGEPLQCASPERGDEIQDNIEGEFGGFDSSLLHGEMDLLRASDFAVDDEPCIEATSPGMSGETDPGVQFVLELQNSASHSFLHDAGRGEHPEEHITGIHDGEIVPQCGIIPAESIGGRGPLVESCVPPLAAQTCDFLAGPLPGDLVDARGLSNNDDPGLRAASVAPALPQAPAVPVEWVPRSGGMNMTRKRSCLEQPPPIEDAARKAKQRDKKAQKRALDRELAHAGDERLQKRIASNNEKARRDSRKRRFKEKMKKEGFQGTWFEPLYDACVVLAPCFGRTVHDFFGSLCQYIGDMKVDMSSSLLDKTNEFLHKRYTEENEKRKGTCQNNNGASFLQAVDTLLALAGEEVIVLLDRVKLVTKVTIRLGLEV
jgi:hypothetical protein